MFKLGPREIDPATENRSGWQVIYTGFILILLCFFIMLSSFASVEKARMMRFARSFADAVNILDGGLSIEKGKRIQNPDLSQPETADPVLDKFERGVRRSVEAQPFLSGLSFSRRQGGLVMTLADKLLFDTANAEILTKALPMLGKIRDSISAMDVDIRIEGHTDDRPISTELFPSNWELSTARAVSVLRFFTKTQAIPKGRLSACGYAEFQPIVPNDTEAHRTQNRRVEIILTPLSAT